MTTRCEDREAGWTSAHLFFEGPLFGTSGDRIITDVVVPFAEDCASRGLVDRYFFVRFADPDSHLRLRLHGRPRELSHRLRSIRAWAGTSLVTAVRRIPYEPELDRYGGPHGLQIAEAVFHASSRTAGKLLKSLVAQGQDLRRGKAAVAMVTLLHALYRSPLAAARLLERYSMGYLSAVTQSEGVRRGLRDAFLAGFDRQSSTLALYLSEAWTRADQQESLSQILDMYHRELQQARVSLDALVADKGLNVYSETTTSLERALDRVVPSYLHMMNNRMGVAIVDEAYLASVVSRSLSSIAATSALKC